jgi:hypothetical protein
LTEFSSRIASALPRRRSAGRTRRRSGSDRALRAVSILHSGP